MKKTKTITWSAELRSRLKIKQIIEKVFFWFSDYKIYWRKVIMGLKKHEIYKTCSHLQEYLSECEFKGQKIVNIYKVTETSSLENPTVQLEKITGVLPWATYKILLTWTSKLNLFRFSIIISQWQNQETINEQELMHIESNLYIGIYIFSRVYHASTIFQWNHW